MLDAEKNEDNDLEKLKALTDCQKKFACLAAGKPLCKARDIGLKSYIECVDENGPCCKFSFSFGNSHFCKCPVRLFFAKRKDSLPGQKREGSDAI